MKQLFIALSLLVGSSAFASNGYDLKMELSMNGKKVSSPRLIVREGAAGRIEQDASTSHTYIEVVAKEGSIENQKGILLNFEIGNVGKDRKRTVVSKPTMLVQENELAKIAVGDKKETMELSVVAKRKAI